MAMTPYATPQTMMQDFSAQKPIVQNDKETLRTFLQYDTDNQSFDPAHFSTYLDSLNHNLPSLFILQTDQISARAESNTHSGSISLFLSSLSDYSYSLYNLCPIPPFDGVELSAIIIRCVEAQIPPDRAAWVIHHYIRKNEISKEACENNLISVANQNPYYFARFSYALYTRNLVNHFTFLKFVADNLPPNALGIYYNDIITTFRIFYVALTDNKRKKEFAKCLSVLLQKRKVQLIQLSIQDNGTEIMNLINNYLTDEIDKRARKVSEIIQMVSLPPATFFRNYIFENFPHTNCQEIAANVNIVIRYLSEEEIQDFIIEICSAVLWVTSNFITVSTIIAYTIKNIKAPFPFHRFVELLFSNLNEIEKFADLFEELQYQGCITYLNFSQYLLIKGYCSKRKEETLKLILALPSLDPSEFILKRVNQYINELDPDNEYDEIIKGIQGDITGNIEKVAKLPYFHRFSISLWLIENQTTPQNFNILVNNLIQMGTIILLPSMFKLVKPESFSIQSSTQIMEIIPLFQSHDIISDLIGYSLTKSDELSMFIYENYKNLDEISQFRQQFAEIKKSEKIINISTIKIRDLFKKHSYLCSLHILDAFHGVKTKKDFDTVFIPFFKYALPFEPLTSKILYNFFIEFCESGCTSSPSKQFVKCLLTTVATNPTLISNQKVMDMLKEFLIMVFQKKLFLPADFLHIILRINKRKQALSINEDLLRIFYQILTDYPTMFTIETTLTKSVIEYFNDSQLFQELLLCLRSFNPPQSSTYINQLLKSKPEFVSPLFSLLPGPLHSEDFQVAFSYFVENVTHATSTFWTIWLMNRARFKPGFPVTPNTTQDKQAIQQHLTTLISCFSSLIIENTNPEKFSTYLNCWTLVSEDQQQASLIVQQTVSDLKSGKIIIRPNLINYLHAALMVVSEQTFQPLCDGFSKYAYSDSDFPLFSQIATSVFIIFVSRFQQSESLIFAISERLLDWIGILYKLKEPCEFLIDGYNFIIAKTCMLSDSFLANLHQRVQASYMKLPEKVKPYILFSQPPQSYKTVENPLYSDFVQNDHIGGVGQFLLDAQPFQGDDDDRKDNNGMFASSFEPQTEFGFMDEEDFNWFV